MPWARLSVRSLTHTLHLPPAHAEIYNGPKSDWLREVLDRLPNLQSLIVRGLPFFDHSALVTLKYTTPAHVPSLNSPPTPSGYVELPGSIPFTGTSVAPAAVPSTFGLRLLDASRCTNVTSSGLCHALRRFDNLLYLNLSWTFPARDTEVLRCFRHFSGLQVLKLRGVNLRDDDIEVLAWAIGRRVRSLDIGHNQLTDRSVRTLLGNCFLQGGDGDGSAAGDRSPVLLHYLGVEMLATYRGEDFERYLRNAFTTHFVSRLAIEDAPEGGITHLYISDNKLSVEGVSGLLRSGRLHVLDVGSVEARPTHRHPLSPGTDEDGVRFPGAEKLAPILTETGSGHSLTCLRIDHSLLTKSPPNVTEEIVPGRVELNDTCVPAVFELDSTEPAVFELPADEHPRFELPGDSIHMVLSPAVGEPPSVTGKEEETWARARRGSACAPEVASVQQQPMLHPHSPVPTSYSQSSGDTVSQSSGNTRPRSYSSVVALRNARKRTHLKGSKSLYPGALPNLTSLVLTNVPPMSESAETAERVIEFVRGCAEETSLARLQARLDYTLPPGRKDSMHILKDSARRLFALQRLVLEMAPEQAIRLKSTGSAWRHKNTRSTTEDRDSEALWAASGTDFSFFGEGEECNLPSLEPMSGIPNLQAMAQKEVFVVPLTNGHQPPLGKQRIGNPSSPPPTQGFDVVAKIAEFRKSRKAAYETSLACGENDPEVEGYWPGLVQVVRPSQHQDPHVQNDEFMDYYGNRFSKNYLYR